MSLIAARSFQTLLVEWTKKRAGAAQGRVVAIDGKTVRRLPEKIAKEIVCQGADYVLAVRENRRWLWECVAESFAYGERTAFA